MLRAFERAEASGDFLLDLRHAHAVLAMVVGERDGGVMNEEQHGIGILAHAAEQVEGDRLLAAAALSDWFDRRRIEPLPFAQYPVVSRDEGRRVACVERDIFLMGGPPFASAARST